MAEEVGGGVGVGGKGDNIHTPTSAYTWRPPKTSIKSLKLVYIIQIFYRTQNPILAQDPIMVNIT